MREIIAYFTEKTLLCVNGYRRIGELWWGRIVAERLKQMGCRGQSSRYNGKIVRGWAGIRAVGRPMEPTLIGEIIPRVLDRIAQRGEVVRATIDARAHGGADVDARPSVGVNTYETGVKWF